MTAPITEPTYIIPGYPYVVYVHGVRVRPVNDEELRECHVEVPGADRVDGIRCGTRWVA